MEHTAATTPRNHQLDGLRGYAALAVVFYHAILGLDGTQIARVVMPSLQNIEGTYERITKIVIALVSGDTAVVVFFVMSGAVLLASLRREERPVGPALGAFAIRRVLRIYPTLVAYLLVAVAVYPLFGLPASSEMFWANLALIDFPLNGATWTLNVEMLAAPLIFAAYLVFRRFREGGLALFLLAVLLLLKARFFAGHIELFRTYVLCFALGMLVPTRIGATVARHLPAYAWIVFLILMLFAKHIVLIGGYNTATNIQQISAALIVTMLYYDTAKGLGATLRRDVSAFLGRISYTLYLFNVLFLEIIQHILRQGMAASRPLEFGLASAAVIVALTIPTAYIVTRFIEEPAIRLGRKLTTKARPTPAAAEAVA